MALDSFYYRVVEFEPHMPVWRANDDRHLWRFTLIFDSKQACDEMITWCNNTFGNSGWNQLVISDTKQALKLDLFTIEQFTLFKMAWLI